MKKENLYEPDCIRTFTGQYVNVFSPNPETFIIEDIAHALSHQCRFGGHLPKFFSVAQHCINVSCYVPDAYSFSALMHDASEAYLMDIPRPIKNRMPIYREIEDGLMRIIAEIFGFQYPLHEEVIRGDNEQLELEWANVFLKSCSAFSMSQVEAEKVFLHRYHELKK